MHSLLLLPRLDLGVSIATDWITLWFDNAVSEWVVRLALYTYSAQWLSNFRTHKFLHDNIEPLSAISRASRTNDLAEASQMVPTLPVALLLFRQGVLKALVDNVTLVVSRKARSIRAFCGKLQNYSLGDYPEAVGADCSVLHCFLLTPLYAGAGSYSLSGGCSAENVSAIAI
jgi:hypothetical protein